jgi:hypothetical protein
MALPMGGLSRCREGDMTNLPHASHLNMDERRDQADEFFAATKPELVPIVSDEVNRPGFHRGSGYWEAAIGACSW